MKSRLYGDELPFLVKTQFVNFFVISIASSHIHYSKSRCTFAWLGRDRRLSKDYEYLPQTGETTIYDAMTDLMLCRLVSSAPCSTAEDLTAEWLY